jgi:NAD(P) transhydrogenase subunit alpha
MRIGIPLEVAPGETRVSIVPETIGRLRKAGLEAVVEAGAGARAGHDDEAYRTAGATVAPGPRELYAAADLVAKVREPLPHPSLGVHEADLIREGAALVSFLAPSRNASLFQRFAARRVTAFAMELVPRISRAQSMDALSSMSTVAGYKAALVAAASLGKFFPLLMTAAGTIAPARVFVLGAGVAGLQAIATSRRLGAVVEAFDVRPAVREEVLSLGATFVALELEAAEGAGGYARALTPEQERRERELIARHVTAADAVIATAMVPGKPAPKLIGVETIRAMRRGSVIVDLAAEMGGNAEPTKPGETVEVNGITIHGPVNLAATMPQHASAMYSRNIAALLQHLAKNGTLALDFEDEITRGACVTHGGRVLFGSDDRPNAHGSGPAAGHGAPAPVAA